MKKHTVISRIFLLYLLLTVFSIESKHIVKRIVDGFPASAGQFPFQISIRNKDNEHICGGSIINKRFILTAGHCLKYKHPRDIRIAAGSTRLSEASDIFEVEKIAHGHYDSFDYSNDISMIKLTKDISFTDLIQPISFHKSDPPTNVTMTISGWGLKQFEDLEPPDELQYLEVMAISLDECIEQFSGTMMGLNEKIVCTFTKYGEGVCYGDSGGPLVFDGKLVGIVSRGRPCATGYPDVFTKVSEYYNWIQTAMSVM